MKQHIEIQWRLRKTERKSQRDSLWQRHSFYGLPEAKELVEQWNLYDRFFEYRVQTNNGKDSNNGLPESKTNNQSERKEPNL